MSVASQAPAIVVVVAGTCCGCCHGRFDTLRKKNISVIKRKKKKKNIPLARDVSRLEPLLLLLLPLPPLFLLVLLLPLLRCWFVVIVAVVAVVLVVIEVVEITVVAKTKCK